MFPMTIVCYCCLMAFDSCVHSDDFIVQARLCMLDQLRNYHWPCTVSVISCWEYMSSMINTCVLLTQSCPIIHETTMHVCILVPGLLPTCAYKTLKCSILLGMLLSLVGLNPIFMLNFPSSFFFFLMQEI